MQTELKSLVDEIGAGFKDFVNRSNATLAGLTDRLEALEARGNTPAGRNGGNRSKGPAYSVLYGPEGQKSYVVPSTSRLSDIPELQKAPEISLDRWMRALVFRDACEDKEAKEFAAEHQAKALGTGSTGVLIPVEYVPQWIDLARAQSVLIRAGATTHTMLAKSTEFSAQTADPTATWTSSEGATLTASDPTFASRTLTAKTIAIRTQTSVEAHMDIPNFGEQITKAYTRALAAAIDQAGIRGTSPAPTGLHTATGVGAVAVDATPTNWDWAIDGVVKFLTANNRLDELSGIIMHPDIWGLMSKLKTGLTNDNRSIEPPDEIENVPLFITTNSDAVLSPQTYVPVLGNFRDLIFGVRLDPVIQVLPSTASMATNLLVEIIGLARVDFLPSRPASFVKCTGMTTS